MSNTTSTQYDTFIDEGRQIFLKKMKDYGTAWRILRVSSITDQIYIKAQRIRSIEEKGKQRVEEGIDGEFLGIINYCIIALIQLDLGSNNDAEMKQGEVLRHFDAHAKKAK